MDIKERSDEKMKTIYGASLGTLCPAELAARLILFPWQPNPREGLGHRQPWWIRLRLSGDGGPGAADYHPDPWRLAMERGYRAGGGGRDPAPPLGADRREDCRCRGDPVEYKATAAKLSVQISKKKFSRRIYDRERRMRPC